MSRLGFWGGLLAPLLATLALSSSGAAAESTVKDQAALQAQGARFWRDAATTDVEAAYALISENHPGVLPQVGDAAFVRTLDAARDKARTRAGQTDSYEGYAATLAAFANAMGDKHIWSRPNFIPARPEWAGLLMSKRGEHWIVADEDPIPGVESLKGAELADCDGRTPESWARETLGEFRVDWSVGAQQIQAAPWLLVDEHNPFVRRPTSCTFDKAGRRVTVPLAWRLAKRDQLTPRIAAAVGAGQAGLGVRAVGDGYWIGLQTLTDPAAVVVAEVRAKADQLRKGAFVVLDLRGDTGGSSLFGEQIARALMGDAFVASRMDVNDDGCDGVWRVSDGNIAQLQFYLDSLGPTRGPEFVKEITAILARAKAAKAAGRPLSGSLSCAAAKPADKVASAPSMMRGRLILVTDNLCFSSCLIVTHDFRALGALHVGQTTDANTHYSEVREVSMPSGLSKFSTLQALSPGEPLRYGPFAPKVPYPGDISDSPRLEAWVLGLAHEAAQPGT